MLKKTNYNHDEMYRSYIHIYTEANPNPTSMKFVLSIMLVPENLHKEYDTPKQAEESPLAQALFAEFSFIKRIFFSMNYITLTKTEDVEWIEVSPQIRNFLQDYFKEQKAIFVEDVMENKIEVTTDSPTVAKIKSILEEYVRPAVEMDGGAIVFDSFEETTGVLKVQLQGSCNGCPSSMVTLKSGIQNLFQRMMPEVKEVVA